MHEQSPDEIYADELPDHGEELIQTLASDERLHDVPTDAATQRFAAIQAGSVKVKRKGFTVGAWLSTPAITGCSHWSASICPPEPMPQPLSTGPADRLILALDRPDRASALELVAAIPELRWVKVGLELFTAAGPGVVAELRQRGLFTG